ncbi:heme o synthase [Vibrio algivorus]|uniref:Protoheme IX farnesyltransferase n=1 Tax=Vibrio algivorus TaxID=1667024 RepID=A0A557P4X4_9VIBR|nr:heme o synthase [Vibrio algivorus]TVO35721.1 protoheme IX farnesyltransferase [Vibrio algivorus]
MPKSNVIPFPPKQEPVRGSHPISVKLSGHHSAIPSISDDSTSDPRSFSEHVRQRTKSYWLAQWRLYYSLTKPKVVMLMLLTALVGMCLSLDGKLPLQPLVLGLLGIGLMAGSAAALNHLIDRRIDGLMARTKNRPLPSGQLQNWKVALFASVIGIVGFWVLYFGVNGLTAWLTCASLVGYAVIYTLYLKRATPQNIVIAGIAGAMPPLLGWTAMTNELHPHAWLLVMIIFIWTPPHFWALAIHRKDEYAKAEIPMLPVTHGVEFTKTSVLLYTILLMMICALPVLFGMSGVLYAIASTVLSLGFVYKACELKYFPKPNSAMQTFKFSIYHLMGLFVALLVDHYVLVG